MATANSHRLRVLLLGGTTEAAELAGRLAVDTSIEATISLAGRTARPRASPIPARIGGFGGVDGLVTYLEHAKIDLLIDATHPFASRMSANAVAAAHVGGRRLLAVERPPWRAHPGDDWRTFASSEDAVAALGSKPKRVFSGLGRLSLDALRLAPRHHYVIRVIDPIADLAGLPNATVITARGPFRAEEDRALFERHGIEAVLAKNSGGSAAYAKIQAARELHLPVLMIDRPSIPPRSVVETVEEAMAWIAAHHASLAERGV